jgi:hypothetical protein
MKTILKQLFFLFIIYAELTAQTGGVKGRITGDKLPLPAANVLILETIYGAVTDERGFYEITDIPPGDYKIRFSNVGYKTIIEKIKIQQGRTVELNINLISSAIELETVEVTGFQQQEVKDTRTSLIDLKPRSAKILPGAVEDVFRTLQSLPGVVAPNDFSSQLIIRGSGPDQNLIIMDDVEIFNPYRLYGVISMFNPEAVSDINLITGGFPAMYGDRLSAVLDVVNKEGDRSKNISGNINASILDANVVLEGRNPFNINGSWILSSRRTYYDLIVEPFVKNTGLVEENVSFPNFHDVQLKLTLIPSKGHKINLNGIYSRDGVNVVSGEKRTTPDSIAVDNFIKNDVASISYHYSPGGKLLNKFIVSWYENSGVTDFNSEILDPSLNRDDFKDIIPDTLSPYLLGFKFNSDFIFRKYSFDDKLMLIWNDHTFEAGAGFDMMRTELNFTFDIDPELKSFFASNPQFRAVLDDLKDIKHYNRYRIYAQNNFSLSEKFFINPGIRLDYYDLLNKIYPAPRLSFSYALDELTTLRGVWGIYYQSPGYEKLLDQNILFDLSERYARNLEAERAYHYVLGVERWLTNEWSLRLESYYKDFNDLIVPQIVTGSRYFTEPIPGMDPRYVSGWSRPATFISDSLTQIPVNNSAGEAYGLEVFLSKRNILNENKISGWISYSLAFADRFQNRTKLPFRFDQRNTLNFVMNYEANSWLSFGIRWQYGSGFPFSEPIGIKPRIILRDDNFDGIPETPHIATRNVNGKEEVIFDINFAERFNSRKPPYHRLDVRITALTRFWNLDWSFYIDVINAYNRKNIIGYDYFITKDLTLGRKATSMFPIIPTLGFSARF